MRLGITGTYSSGKTFTSLVVANYFGMPRTEASTMREILPYAVPGKTLDECTSSELLQMIVIRHTERVLHENKLGDEFISDGCSLQEWIYGSVRVKYGVNPNDSVGLAADESVELTPELAYFEDVMSELGKAFKRHVKNSFDMFIHLRNELPLSKDGHRPVNENFRSSSDEILQETLTELEIPFQIISGSMDERIDQIAEILGKEPICSKQTALDKAAAQYKQILM